jgi:invasion protein IalB
VPDQLGPDGCASGEEKDSVMNFGIASGPDRPGARALALALTTTLLAIAVGSTAFAQAPPAAPPQQKAAPKAAAPAATAPKGPAQQKPPDAPQSPAAADAQQPQLIYSPWTKFCLKGQETNAQQVCFTGKDGRIESGMPVIAAVLIEPEGDAKKVLRVTLPLGMQLPQGTRVIVDQGQPMNSPYIICFTNGCMADYEASAELIGKLKKGQGLVVQGINSQGQPISLVLPLTDFGKAYDGAPTDPKVFEEQQKKLQDDLQKRAEEARKKLEGQQPATR